LPNAAAADVLVLASKGQDCRKGSVISVSLQDLRDMQNSMRETIDQGLGDLQSYKGGLPAPPSSAMAAPMQASYFEAAPPVDASLASELSQQARQVSQVEQEVVSQGGTSSGPVTISLGQTPQQVEALSGSPKNIVHPGEKKMYLYKDMKMTFIGGKAGSHVTEGCIIRSSGHRDE
jgi:hypothetical protein